MKLAEFKKQIGIPVRKREKYNEPTVDMTVSFTLSVSTAKKLYGKMAEDGGLTLGDLVKRLINYYIADHDGYGR